jgi:hypothetical protein
MRLRVSLIRSGFFNAETQRKPRIRINLILSVSLRLCVENTIHVSLPCLNRRVVTW